MSDEPIDEELSVAYIKPAIDYLKAKFERELAEFYKQLEPPSK